MAKSYEQIVKQIEALKQEADKLRRKEVEGVVARMKEAISVYGLTAEDLGLAPKRGPRAATAAAAPAKKRGRKPAKGAAVAKYRNEHGESWVGRGKRPKWLTDALAAGKTLADFAVK